MNAALMTVAGHIESLGPQLATQRTEAVVFNKKRKAELSRIKLQGQKVTLGGSMEYPGIIFENKSMMFGAHLNAASKKA